MVPWALVIEDNEALRSVMAEMFQSIGLNVLTARDGAEALDVLDDFMPDLITLDLHIPDMSGLSLLQHIRQLRGGQRVTVVVVTGDCCADHPSEAKLADMFLQKPVSIKDLVGLTERLIDSVTETVPDGEAIRRELRRANPMLSPKDR